MYGHADIYNSPESLGNHDDDDFGFLGIGGGAPGIGIHIGKKARQRKWDARLAKTMGKLKELFDKDKLDKAQNRAKKLTKIVSKLEKIGEYDAEENPEVVAWMDYAESGDVDALNEALGAVTWTGEEAEGAEDEPSGLVRTPGSGVRGGARIGRRRRRLPPGFRPGAYGMWRGPRKREWLARHPNAASRVDPRDPGQGWGRGRGRGGGRSERHPVRRAARDIRQSYRKGRRQERRGRGGGGGAAYRAGRRRGRRGTRYGEEHEDEFSFGMISGRIGIEAFPGVEGSSITSDMLVEDWDDGLDDDIEIAFEDEDYDELYAEGSTADKIQSEGSQFGAVFKRKTEKRVEAARRKYERLRDHAVDPEDWEKVEVAMRDYRKLAQAYKKAAVAPTPRTGAQALAALTYQPLFRSQAAGVFREAGGIQAEGVEATPVPGMRSLFSEEAVFSDLDMGEDWDDFVDIQEEGLLT